MNTFKAQNYEILLKHEMNLVKEQLLLILNKGSECYSMNAHDYIEKMHEIDNFIGCALLYKVKSYDSNIPAILLINDAELNFDEMFKAYKLRNQFIMHTHRMNVPFLYTCVFWHFNKASFWLNFDANKLNEIARLTELRLPAYNAYDYKLEYYALFTTLPDNEKKPKLGTLVS